MSHADLAEEPDTSVASPPSWPHTLLVAAGWGVAAALCAGIAWITAAAAVRPHFEAGLRAGPAERTTEPAVEMAAIGGGCGLLVGTLTGFLLARRRGLDHQLGAAGVVGGVGALAGGIGGGLSVRMMAEFGSLPPEVSSGLAWAVAGLFAGMAGGIGRRCWPEPAGSDLPRAANWAIVGALGGALASAGGAVVGPLYFDEPLAQQEWTRLLFDLTAYTAGTGAAAGVFAGNLVGLLSHRGRRVFGSRLESAGRLGLLGGLTGLLVGLAPMLVVGLGPFVPPELAFALAGAAAGLVAGVIGHSWTHRPAETGAESDEETETGPRETAATLVRTPGPPMVRLLPVLAVAVLTFVAAMATFPPGTRAVLIAVGVLGLAVAYVQAGQERRIRELERRLRQARDAPPVTASPE
jgi:hypothetical protein